MDDLQGLDTMLWPIRLQKILLNLISGWPSIDQSQEHYPVSEAAIIVAIHKYLWQRIQHVTVALLV